MSDFAEELKQRTKRFGVRVYRVVESLPKNGSASVLGKQLLRCGTSVGANYRAGCRARSAAEFRAKLGIVEEECDEAIYWLEMLIETGLVPADRLAELVREANELLAVIVTSINTSKRNSP